MAVYREELRIKTAREGDIVDITNLVENVVKRSGISDGVVHVFAIGSTAAISTMEYEPGLKQDLPEILERIAPKNIEYKHHLRWGDYNGHSHIRATILGPSLTAHQGW